MTSFFQSQTFALIFLFLLPFFIFLSIAIASSNDDKMQYFYHLFLIWLGLVALLFFESSRNHLQNLLQEKDNGIAIIKLVFTYGGAYILGILLGILVAGTFGIIYLITKLFSKNNMSRFLSLLNIGIQILRRLTDLKFWFGNGRSWGIQRGTLEQKLNDPHYKNNKLFQEITDTIYIKLSIDSLRDLQKWLINNINKGTIDNDIIDFLLYRTNGIFESEEFTILTNDEKCLFNLLKVLIANATENSALPFLIQCLQTNCCIKNSKSTYIDTRTIYKQEEREGEDRYTYYNYYVDIEYKVHDTIDEYTLTYPFAESIKDQLSQMESKSILIQIESAIESFEKRKKLLYKKVVETREEYIGEVRQF